MPVTCVPVTCVPVTCVPVTCVPVTCDPLRPVTCEREPAVRRPALPSLLLVVSLPSLCSPLLPSSAETALLRRALSPLACVPVTNDDASVAVLFAVTLVVLSRDAELRDERDERDDAADAVGDGGVVVTREAVSRERDADVAVAMSSALLPSLGDSAPVTSVAVWLRLYCDEPAPDRDGEPDAPPELRVNCDADACDSVATDASKWASLRPLFLLMGT